MIQLACCVSKFSRWARRGTRKGCAIYIHQGSMAVCWFRAMEWFRVVLLTFMVLSTQQQGACLSIQRDQVVKKGATKSTPSSLGGVVLGRRRKPVTARASENSNSNSSSSSSSSSASGLVRTRSKTPFTHRRHSAEKSPSVVVHVPTPLEHVLAGTLGGISGVLAAYPLDTVRIRMQMGGKRHSAVRMASDLLREAGIAGFYRGVASPLAGAVLIKSLVFGSYGLFQSLVRRATGIEYRQLSLPEIGAAAMGSGILATFVVTPVERVKVVMQATPRMSRPLGPITASFARDAVRAAEGASARGGGGGRAGYANAWVCAKSLVKEQGLFGGLYAGLSPTVWRVAPGYVCYFATYEAIKRFLVRRDLTSETSAIPCKGMVVLKTAIAGATAGATSCLPVYPFDVVKSRMQSAAAGGPGMLETAAMMWRSEGLHPFFHGLMPSILCVTVANAATFVVYEAAMDAIIKRRVAAVRMTEQEKADVLPEHSPEALVQ